MVMADDTTAAVRAAVALANHALDPDTLTTLEDLAGFFVEHDYTGRLVGDEAELRGVRRLRPRLRTLLLSERDDAVGQINTMLAEARALPRLVRHGSTGWHVHAIDDDAPLPTRILVETAMAMIDLVRADELSRLAVCEDDECEGVVFDASRNRSKRYCGTACTNRNAVAAYRERQRR